MNEPASQVIAARVRAHDTLLPTLAWSVAGHVAIVAAMWLAPASTANQTPRTVMTINLGGAAGPRAGGLTQTGGRAIPERPPEPPKPVPRTPPPPASSRQAAVLPSPKAAPARPDRATPTPAPSAPSVPEPPRDGNTRVETGARGQGFGLATGGAGVKGLELEVTNFCCPQYLEQLRIAVERGWQATPGLTGATTVRFVITRPARVEMITVVQSSGNQVLDAAAQRAIATAQNLPALPAEYREGSLALRMRFENRRSGEY